MTSRMGETVQSYAYCYIPLHQIRLNAHVRIPVLFLLHWWIIIFRYKAVLEYSFSYSSKKLHGWRSSRGNCVMSTDVLITGSIQCSVDCFQFRARLDRATSSSSWSPSAKKILGLSAASKFSMQDVKAPRRRKHLPSSTDFITPTLLPICGSRLSPVLPCVLRLLMIISFSTQLRILLH